MISIREKTLRRICALSMWKRTAVAVGSRRTASNLYAMTCGEQESIRCILSRIIHRFYERYGWEYFCMVEEDEGGMIRMYIHKGKG